MSRAGRVTRVVLASLVPILLTGCGTGTQGSPASTEPRYALEPFTHEQRLVEEGGRLIVADGCTACHLAKATRSVAPSFSSFAGHDVTLADGRHVLVDEHFLREALSHPGRDPIKGYDPALMVSVARHLHLSGQPMQVAALAAFIEQIGPEPEPG